MLKNKKIDKKNLSKYRNKWCLHRVYSSDDYCRVFVVDIKDEIVMTYNDVYKRYEYIPLDKFENGDFFISPFNEKSPIDNNNENKKTSKSIGVDPDWTYTYPGYDKVITVPQDPHQHTEPFPNQVPIPAVPFPTWQTYAINCCCKKG